MLFPFYKTLIKCWYRCKGKKTTLGMCDIVWLNECIVYKRNVLYFDRWVKQGIVHINQIIDNRLKLIKHYNDICQIVGPSPHLIFEYNALKTALENAKSELTDCNHETPNTIHLSFHGKVLTKCST